MVDFGGLQIAFDDRVLRPRPWTLAQSRWAQELLQPPGAPDGPVLELFAGAGHIGLAAVASLDRDLLMVDLNPVATAYARANADTAGLSHRVTVREGRVDQVLEPWERFALIIADPPWVSSVATDAYPEDPLQAIDGGPDGLDLARAACSLIERHLVTGGHAIVQLGSVQQSQVLSQELIASSALRIVETRMFDDGVLVQVRHFEDVRWGDLGGPRLTWG